jgi:uncharacterized coiled-coil protein SlyX
MARAEVGEHVEASGAVHVQRAWVRVAEMEGKAAEMEEKVSEQREEIADLRTKVAEQAEETAGLQKRAQALTHVFTWSTDTAWKHTTSEKYTFTGGVRGYCYTKEPDDQTRRHWMAFALEEGCNCTIHFRCSILDQRGKILRVVSNPVNDDVRQHPIQTAAAGHGQGAQFDLTAADKAGAVRVDGSIKLRMVVHLYLPE